MAKDIMTSGIEMSDVIKTTGFPVPGDMEGKTFAECVSGGGGSGGGSIPLYAWHTAFSFEYMPIYTTTESPKVGDKVYTGADGDMDTEILSGVITSIKNDVYRTNINTSYPAFSGRYEEKDIIISGDAQGGIIAEPLAVTENGVYTAPSGKAYSPVTVNVPSGATDLIFNVKCYSLTDNYILVITFPRSNKVTDIAETHDLFGNIHTEHYSYNENGYIVIEQASEANVKVSVVYDGDTYSYTYTGRDYGQHDLVKE